MYPHGRSLVKKHKDAPFALIGVNSDDDLEMVRDVIKKEHITWRSFWNGPRGTSGPIASEWNVTGWPTVYLIDAEGRIRHRDPLPDQLDKHIETLLAELHPKER